MCRGTKNTFKKPFCNPKRPRHQNRNAKSIKKFVASNDDFEKDDYFIINILSCVLSASVLPMIKNKYSVEEVYV